jgi:hypothetical protein
MLLPFRQTGHDEMIKAALTTIKMIKVLRKITDMLSLKVNSSGKPLHLKLFQFILLLFFQSLNVSMQTY